MGRGGKFVLKRSKKRRICFDKKGSDDSDEDYVLEEDEESNDSEGSIASSAENSSEGSFDFEAISIGSDEEEEEERKVVRSKNLKPKKDSLGWKRTRVKRPRVSDDEEEDYDFDYGDDDDDEVEEEERNVARLKDLKPKKGSLGWKRTRVKRPRVSDDEEEDYDFDDGDYDDEVEEEEDEDEDEEERKVVRSKDFKPRKGSLGWKRTRAKRSPKRYRVSDDEEEDYDFDDGDDEEFTPDGIDCGDEEEELQVKKKSDKVRRRVSPKKVSARSRKRKRKSKVSKKPLRNNQRRRLVVRRSADDDFVDDNKVVKEKRKKNTRRTNKRLVVHSDSDFVSSGSSDLEYTISDEEKELLREATSFCGNFRTCIRNSSLSKRLQDNGASDCHQQKPMERKGKEKVNDLRNDTGKQVCGICLSEEGKGTIRGTLNCCSHYFCFACIMEWSKVESRCPFCKQRFVTIHKPTRSNIGIDLRNSVIRVPKRDQVYRPSEEELRGYLDPYANVVCMECQRGGDDNLMLLCDICDSPSHTFCVGLGREVPEGNWYCEGCRTSVPGSSNLQVQDPVPDQGTSNSSLPTDLPTRRINIEDFDPTPQYSVSIPDPSYSRGIGILPSPRFPVREDVHDALPSPSGTGASTLSGRRRIHRQIHNLLSNNRISQMAGRTDGILHTNVETRVVDSEVEQCEETTTRHQEH